MRIRVYRTMKTDEPVKNDITLLLLDSAPATPAHPD